MIIYQRERVPPCLPGCQNSDQIVDPLDHVGNAALFPHATWFIQSREYAAMIGPDYAKYGYSPKRACWDGARWLRLLSVAGTNS